MKTEIFRALPELLAVTDAKSFVPAALKLRREISVALRYSHPDLSDRLSMPRTMSQFLTTSHLADSLREDLTAAHTALQ